MRALLLLLLQLPCTMPRCAAVLSSTAGVHKHTNTCTHNTHTHEGEHADRGVHTARPTMLLHPPHDHRQLPAAAAGPGGGALVPVTPGGGSTAAAPGAPGGVVPPAAQKAIMAVVTEKGNSSAAVSRRLASKWPRPVWHAPWRCYRVISGHLGCEGETGGAAAAAAAW